MPLLRSAMHLAETGHIPDAMIRLGIRQLLRSRLRSLELAPATAVETAEDEFAAQCRHAAVAEVPQLANEQHYEVPAGLFETVLGPRLKYSCCHFGEGATTLAEAEDSALAITAARAELHDGQRILELGCGWGSLTLWMAGHFPNARITAVSNSASQREFIEARAAEWGFDHIEVITADMNEFAPRAVYDRVVSIEMFEHMRNHAELLRRIAGWLAADGKLFVHIFCHRSRSWLFEDHGPGDWMARQFFSGGMMPALTLLPRYQQHLRLADQWQWSGRHYEQTCNAWLRRLDAARPAALEHLAHASETQSAQVQLQRWRMFFMSCAELFGFHGGAEWLVTHLLFERGGTLPAAVADGTPS